MIRTGASKHFSRPRTRFIHIRKDVKVADEVMSSNNIDKSPVGIFQSWKALRPVDRLLVICSFSSMGFLGLYFIGDNDNANVNIDVNSSGMLASVQRFFSWAVTQASKDFPLHVHGNGNTQATDQDNETTK